MLKTLLLLLAGVAGAAPDRSILLPHTSLIQLHKILSFDSPGRNMGPLVFSQDGRTLATMFLGQSKKNTIVLWDAAQGTEIRRITEKSWLICLAMSPDGKTLAACSGDDVLIWDTAKGKRKKLWAGPRHEYATGSDFQPVGYSSVLSLAFSPDGKTLAVGRTDPAKKDDLCFLLDLETGRKLRDFYCMGDESVRGVAFSPDGKTLAATNGADRAHLFDPATGSHRQDVHFSGQSRIGPVCFSPDGKRLSAGPDYGDWISILDIPANTMIKTFKHDSTFDTAGAFSPSGDLFAFDAEHPSGPQNKVVLADLAADTTATLQAPVPDASEVAGHVAFSPDGRFLAASAIRGTDQRVVFLWDISGLAGLRKSDFETSEEYKARLEKWKSPYVSAVALGAYDADQGGFQADLAGQQVFIPVPRDQARSVQDKKEEMFVQGFLRYADPWHLRLAAATLADAASKNAFALQNAPERAAKPAAALTLAPASSEDISQVPDFKAKARPDDFAVIIGIERYQDAPSSDYSLKDAALVKDYLKALGIPERNIESLSDNRATKSAFEKTFEAWLPNRAKKESRVVIYYSGHGAPDPASGEAYLVPFDGDPNYLDNTGFPLKRLYADLGRLHAKETVVLLDACFSGAGGRSLLAQGARPLVNMQPVPKFPGGVAVLSAASGSQISMSSAEKGHGLFTYYLLKALRNGKQDAASIHAYISPLVQDEAKLLNVQQTPSLARDPAGEFSFSLAP